jgi:hypothetical protein
MGHPTRSSGADTVATVVYLWNTEALANLLDPTQADFHFGHINSFNFGT